MTESNPARQAAEDQMWKAVTEISDNVYSVVIENLKHLRRAEANGKRALPKPHDQARLSAAIRSLTDSAESDELVKLLSLGIGLGAAKASQVIVADWELKPSAANRKPPTEVQDQ